MRADVHQIMAGSGPADMEITTMEKPIQVMSLCPSCSECPAVEVFTDSVRIGEGPNTLTLKKPEWNQLVEAIRAGKLRSI
jgi:hypothetical protein